MIRMGFGLLYSIIIIRNPNIGNDLAFFIAGCKLLRPRRRLFRSGGFWGAFRRDPSTKKSTQRLYFGRCRGHCINDEDVWGAQTLNPKDLKT